LIGIFNSIVSELEKSFYQDKGLENFVSLLDFQDPREFENTDFSKRSSKEEL